MIESPDRPKRTRESRVEPIPPAEPICQAEPTPPAEPATPEVAENDDLEIIEAEPMEPEVILLDEADESDKKVPLAKTEFVVSKFPTLRTLRRLLLYGVPAVMREARWNSTRLLTDLEESHLEQMYHTMLATVPLVRALDTMKE